MNIIFTDNLDKLKTVLKNQETGFCADYVLFKLTEETNRIKTYLDKDNNFTEINPRNVYPDFKNDFVGLISLINKNNHSLFWWALNFTNKNPITTDLCNKVFNFLVITRLLKNKNNLIVVSEDKDLYKRVLVLAKDFDSLVINAIDNRIYLKGVVKNILPFAVLYAYMRILFLKLCSLNVCRTTKLKRIKKLNVLLTLINHQSFLKNGEYRDAYFGDFPKYLKDKQIPFVILGEVLFPPYGDILKKAVSNKNGYLIVSKECFLSLKDLTLALFQSLFKFFSPLNIKGSVKINDVDLSFFVKKMIREDYCTTKFFSNICFYYCVARMSRHLTIDKFYYPFENRAFEKMSILALRKFSKETKIIGYQHASISQRHTNFFLEKDEFRITPMPDLIMTMGEISKNIMKDSGNFPEKILRAGCALRQSVVNNTLKAKRPKITNLFIALATNIDEYVKVLRFLDNALDKEENYNIWIRPHPVFPLEDAMKILGRPKFKFYKADKEPLETCYKWADLVLYVHSTLSLEALTFGIPVINLVTPDCLNPDPLFGFDDLRWSVSNPKKLAETISLIDSIPGNEFKERQEKAREYMKKYVTPVTESNLKAFCDV